MADYIDREKLVMMISGTISEVAKEAPYDRVWFSRMAARQAEIINIIYDMPAADVVEVVRCKDCDCWNESDGSGRKGKSNYRCACTYWMSEDGCTYYTAPNDFCSNGGRRDNEQADP